MNIPIDREFVAHAVIAFTVCAGAWFFIVQPKAARLAELEAAIAQHSIQPFVNEAQAARFAERTELLRKQAVSVNERNTLASDSARLYRLVMATARSQGVTVRSLQPGNDRRGADEESIVVVPVEVTVEGTFRQVSDFLDAVDDIEGFVRARSLTLAPTEIEGQPFVDARFGFEAIAFNLSDMLAQLAGANDAVE